jgi:ankyrin repeat protein
VSVQSMLDYLIMWGQDWIEEENELLPECFIEVTRQLLRHGALWDEIFWPLIIQRDGLGILPMLASLGANFNGLALERAADIGNLEVMRWLLDAGADVNAKWTTSNRISILLSSAIDFAIQPTVLQLLLQHGARLPVDIHGSSLVGLLHRAIRTYLDWEDIYPKTRRDPSGNLYLGMIEVILALGPDLSHPQAGDPDLLEACFIHSPDLGEDTDCCLAAFELLLEHGAPVSSSALATLIGLGGRSDVVNLLISMGADIHGYAFERQRVTDHLSYETKTSKRAFSPIQAAIYRKNRKQIILLLEKGADINQPAFHDRGVTALQAACQIEEKHGERGTRLRMVKFLLELGADADGPPAQKNGLSALQIAALNGDLEIALMLLHRGADPNTLDTIDKMSAETALDFAAKYGRLDMLQLLLTVGGRSGSPGRTGVDGAIELAREERCYAIVKYLEAHAESRSGSSSD